MALVTAFANDLDPDYLDDWCSFYGVCKVEYDGESLQITYADSVAAASAARALKRNGVCTVRVCEVPNDPVVNSLLAAVLGDYDEDMNVNFCTFGEGFPDRDISQVPPTVIALSPRGELVYPKPADFSSVAKPFTTHCFGNCLRALAVITLLADEQRVDGMAVALSPHCFAISKHLLGKFEQRLKRRPPQASESTVIFVVDKVTSARLKFCHEPQETHDVSAAIISYIEKMDPQLVHPTTEDDGCAVQDDFACIVLTEPLFHHYFVPGPLSSGPYAIIAQNSMPTQSYVVQKLLPFANLPSAASKCYKNGQLLLGSITATQLENLYRIAGDWVANIKAHFYADFNPVYLCVANETVATRTSRSFRLTLTCTQGASGAPCITPMKEKNPQELIFVGFNSAFRGRNHLVRVDTCAFATEYIAAMLKCGCAPNKAQKKYLEFAVEKYPGLGEQVHQLLHKPREDNDNEHKTKKRRHSKRGKNNRFSSGFPFSDRCMLHDEESLPAIRERFTGVSVHS
eukprot:TRINITY_DN4293_c1_g2_i1.p1 TRINITY_DN4293_c1_g2~~TRINITY_DN4293_c1_g2_i1.p1  ORF type:complete len:541 (-),score=65.88 TRINITY_DN4293_c1_g2_i1:21-1562(-)